MFRQARSRSVQPFARAVHPTADAENVILTRGELHQMCTARIGTWRT